MWVKRFALGLAITIILPCVVYYGVTTFSPVAEYRNYTKVEYVEVRGKEVLGEKEKLPKRRLKSLTVPDLDKSQKELFEKEYDAGIKRFNKHLFLIAVPVGILVIVLGLIMPVPGVGSGLMFGGILTLVYGYFTYWSDLPIAIRFVSLLIGLMFLIIIGWLKLGKKG